MPEYVVKQGDHLAAIASRFGFADYRTIWNDPANADLKQRRPDPNILSPGDVVIIPERQPKEEQGATDQRHRFRSRGLDLKMRLKIEDFDGRPLVGAKCEVLVGARLEQLTTDGDGLIELSVARDARNGVLRFEDPLLPFDLDIPLEIGGLDPVDTVPGQKNRLHNLGYYRGEFAEEATGEFRYAVEEFQCDHGLTVDGVCGPQTQAKLKDKHGC